MLAIGRHAEYARMAIADLLHWWRQDLLTIVPAPLRGWLTRPAPTVVFQPNGDAILALRSDKDGLRTLGRWPVASDDAEGARAWAAGILANVNRRRFRIGFRVPSGTALHRTVVLPHAVLENLRQAIGYDLDRLTPYRAEDVVFDARVAALDPATATCTVELVVVPRRVLSRAIEDAAHLGIEPDFVDAQGIPIDFLAHSDVPSNRTRSRVTRGLAILALALGTGVLAIPVMRQASEAETAVAALEAAQQRAEYAARLRREISTLEAARSTLRTKARQAADPLHVLHALTTLLPDDAFLTQWEVTEGRLQITGHARSAVAILAAIEDSPLFEGTSFRAPVTQSSHPGREHFQIAASLSKEGSP
jgi:general secretion pathway protein L